MGKPIPIPGYPNCFREGRVVSIFLSEKDGKDMVPPEYRHFLNTDLVHGDSITSIANNNRGNLFTDSFTFYASKTGEEFPEIICFMIIPKVFFLKPNLSYDDYLRLTKNLFQAITRRVNQASYDSNKLDQATSPFDFMLADYLEKLHKVEAKLNTLHYGQTRELISSDKLQGEIDETLWLQNGNNPFNIPQWVQSNHISEILVLTYECLDFLYKARIADLPDSPLKAKVKAKIEYLTQRIKGNAHLREPIKGKNFSQELKQLKLRFNRVRNHTEILNNPQLFKSLQMLFYSEINDNAIVVKTYNITKIWEDMMAEELGLDRTQIQVVTKFYGDYKSNPDAIDGNNKVIDFKYKVLDSSGPGEYDVLKLWRDVYSHNKISNTGDGTNPFVGELIYVGTIVVEPGQEFDFELKASQSYGPVLIENTEEHSQAIKLQYSVYNMFKAKK